MSAGGAHSRRTLVLAPKGRDGVIAAAILGEAECPATLCNDLPALLKGMREGAGLALVVDDVLRSADLSALSGWIADQPA